MGLTRPFFNETDNRRASRKSGYGKYNNATYEKGWSDEDAASELGANFPDFAVDDCALVCDDCYKAMLPKPLSEIERQFIEIIAATPEWRAAQKAMEDNILYGTPLPQN